jgi:hypothetical protein
LAVRGDQAAIIFTFVIGMASRKVCIGFCRSTSVPDGAAPHHTTRLENTHGTEFRDLFYRFHPWSGFRIAVHVAIDRPGGLVFRRDIAGSDAERWLEIPAWV